MDESARQLDQAFVKRAVRPVSVGQPEFLEHIVRFVKQAAIKTFEVAQVVRRQFLPAATVDQGGNLRALFAHGSSLRREVWNVKRETRRRLRRVHAAGAAYVFTVRSRCLMAAILAAVKSGILPPGRRRQIASGSPDHTPFPPGRMPGSTAGKMPAATVNTYGNTFHASR